MNETQLATTCSLLKLGDRYIEFTIPFSILFAGFEKFPSQKVKNKNSLFNLCNLLFNLHFPVQVPGPNLDLSPPFQILPSRFSMATVWGAGGEVLRMFLPWASPLNFSQSEFISLLFSGISGTSILSLTTACPISRLARSLFIPEMESFIQKLSSYLSPPFRAEHNQCLFR